MMMLEEKYIKTYMKFKKGRFNAIDFARLHGISSQSSKVLIHRLSKNNQFFRAARGEYVALSPESFLKLEEVGRKNKKMLQIVLELLRIFPELRTIVLYGSRIRGQADKLSDYDVLLILKEKTVETTELRERIEKKLRIKLHLTVYSERGYRNAVLSEPYIRFWLSEATYLDEGKVLQSPLPPIPKMAYQEWLSTAKTYMENAKIADQTGKRCKYYFTALEVLEFIRAALQLSYDFGVVKQRLIDILGLKMVKKIRVMGKLSTKDTKVLEHACSIGFRTVAALLDKMGDNETDVYWKAQLSVIS